MPKKKRPDSLCAQDIIAAAKLAQSFVEGMTSQALEKDLKTQAALCRQLEIIGEASVRLSATFRQSLPEIPWKDMIGMRNILIHLYEDVEDEQLWRTVKDDLPQLISVLKAALRGDK